MAMTVVALLVIDQNGAPTGEVYNFCSPLCRSYLTRELSTLYRYEGEDVRAAPADPATLVAGSICETCGTKLV